MKALRLEFYLESPALMTGVANAEENSSITLPYIPGAAIRGAAIGAYLRGRSRDYDLAADEDARALFFDNRVFFLNGYPAYPSGNRRALPVPRSWHVEKGKVDDSGRDVYDFALYDQEVDNPKVERKPFFWPGDEGDVPLFNPPRRSTVHNSSEKPMVKKAGDSTVFRYEALAADQRFVAYVLSEDGTLLNDLRASYLPDGMIRLGGSKTAGYGLMRLKGFDPVDWQGEYDRTAPDGCTIITLLSDTILLTEDGQPTADLHSYLKRVLNRPDLPQPAAFAQTRLTGGFNRKWGLPLPQAWAVVMGSVFAYRAADLSPDELVEFVHSGIGLRREEGFGRIGVNVNDRANFTGIEPDAPLPTRVTLSESSSQLARRMAQRRLSAAAAAAIASYMSDVKFDAKPENAQLSQLRVIIAGVQRERQGLSRIPKHLDRLKARSREQFSRRRLSINGQSVTWESWLTDRATKLDGLELLQEKEEVDLQKTIVAGQAPVIDDALKLDVTCRLIDAVLRKATKEK